MKSNAAKRMVTVAATVAATVAEEEAGVVGSAGCDWWRHDDVGESGRYWPNENFNGRETETQFVRLKSRFTKNTGQNH